MNRKLVFIVKLLFYFSILSIFISIPTSFLESGRSLCLVKNIFKKNCPGCGMTRALSCIFHGEFEKAFQYNKFVVIVFPLLCYVSMCLLFKDLKL